MAAENTASVPVAGGGDPGVPAGAAGPACPYCLTIVAAADEAEGCPACRATYHRECWRENGGCAVYGCTCVPAIESRSAIEVPMSYWGRENKPCPSCGREILAAALRCRHCGTTFTSARPQDAGEFQRDAALAERMPAVRRQVVLWFVLGLIPFTAPIAAIRGLIWWRTHEEELAALPPLHAALGRIGVFAAAVLTGGLALLTVLYTLVRG